MKYGINTCRAASSPIGKNRGRQRTFRKRFETTIRQEIIDKIKYMADKESRSICTIIEKAINDAWDATIDEPDSA